MRSVTVSLPARFAETSVADSSGYPAYLYKHDTEELFDDTISVPAYASPMWHTSLTNGQSDGLGVYSEESSGHCEREPVLLQGTNRGCYGMQYLNQRREVTVKKFFAIVEMHKVHYLLPEQRSVGYNFQHKTKLRCLPCKSKRFASTLQCHIH